MSQATNCESQPRKNDSHPPRDFVSARNSGIGAMKISQEIERFGNAAARRAPDRTASVQFIPTLTLSGAKGKRRDLRWRSDSADSGTAGEGYGVPRVISTRNHVAVRPEILRRFAPQDKLFYFLNSASNALRASSGVWILPGLSAARSLTTLAWKNVHSLRACLLATRAGMFSRHSQVAVVSKKRQLPQVWRSAPHFTQVSSNVGASRATRC